MIEILELIPAQQVWWVRFDKMALEGYIGVSPSSLWQCWEEQLHVHNLLWLL